MNFQKHLTSSHDLVTPYSETRAGFIRIAFEKNRQATPYVEEAKMLKSMAAKIDRPSKLVNMLELRSALLTASGVSEKAKNYLEEADQVASIQELIAKFLEPAGENFVDELVFRFLLTRGDTLGGRMRNIAGTLAQRRLTRTIIAALTIRDQPFSWLHAKSKKWQQGDKNDPDIELSTRGLSWVSGGEYRTLIYNFTVSVVKKNIDLCLLNLAPTEFNFKRNQKIDGNHYIALGELKGGIDPAGADEHWKTANSALGRIRNAFMKAKCSPLLFFIGAAIEQSMADEIFTQLEMGQMANAANLTNDEQLMSISKWLVTL